MSVAADVIPTRNEKTWSVRAAGLRTVLVTVAVLVLAAAVVLAAAAGRGAREMRFACAKDSSGLMRYVKNPSACRSSRETAIAIAHLANEGKQLRVCASVRLGPAKVAGRKGKRTLVAYGPVRRVSQSSRCSVRHQRAFSLPGGSVTYFCAAQAGGLLRIVSSPVDCHRRETALFVPKHEPQSKPPSANPQSLSTDEGVPVAITLTATSSPPGKHATYEIVSAPTHGTISGSPPAVTYTPNPGYFGTDQFKFTASEGKLTSAPGTVSITVNRVNQAPVNTVPGAQSVNENTNLVFSLAGQDAISVADADSEGGSEEVKLGVAHGTLKLGSAGGLGSSAGNETAAVTLNGTIAALNGALEGLTYTPASGFHGSDGLTVETNDLGHTGLGGPKTAISAVAITILQVDRTPVNTVPLAQSTNENATLTFASLNTNQISVEDTDSEGGSEQVTLTAAHGTLKLPSTAGLVSATGNETASVIAKGTIAELNSALQGLSYTPTHNYFGADAVKLETDDLGHTGVGGPKTASSTVPITITPVVYDTAANDSYSTAENAALSVNSLSGVLTNDSDSDKPPLALKSELVSGPAHGTLTLKSAGSFEYVPAHNFAGADTFTYKDNDGNTDSNTATVTITVSAVTYDKALADSYSVHENASLSPNAAEGVLKNDSDSDTPPLTLKAELVEGPKHGKLTFESNGSFHYEPATGFVGSDSFTYRDNDGNTTSNTATVTITVEHVDQAPVNTVPAGQSIKPGATLVFSAAHANAISVSDADSEGGVERVEVTVSHGTLTAGSTAGLASHTGEGTAKLTLEGTISALDKALEGLAYTPAGTQSDTLTLKTNDLGHTGAEGPKTATSEVPITVVHVNEAPVNTVPGTQDASENATLVFSAAHANAISVSDADSEGGVERVEVTVSHGTLTAGSTAGLASHTGEGTAKLTLEGTISALDKALAGLTYAPSANYSGTDELTVLTNDLGHTGSGGAKTASSTVEITVVHPPPVPLNPTYSGAIGNTQFSVGVAAGGAPDVQQSGSVLPNPATEPDGSTLTVTKEVIATARGGSVHMNENGTFAYQPPVGFQNGSDTFAYTENDSRGAHAKGTVTIKVANARVWYVNDNAGSNGNGESDSPFNVLSAVSGAGSPTGSGDVIFLYGGGGNYTGGLEPKANQTIVGQDEGLTVEGDHLIDSSGGNPAITDGSGAGIELAEGDTVKGITVTGTLGPGIAASNIGSFTLDAKVAVTASAGNGVEVGGGSGTITDEAAISNSAAHSILIEKRSGGTVTVSGPLTDTGTGVLLNSNTGATIDFTGKLSLDTATHSAFSASGGGTVTATASESTATTTTATAINVQNTTIGASGLKFQSVSASGAADGIELLNTGVSGGLSVTGSGTASSGGEITKPTNVGVLLEGTSSPSLSWMHIHEAANFAISGETVSGLTLNHDVIDGTNGGATSTEPASVALTELTGAATISNSTITGGYEDDVRIENSAGTLSPLTLSADTLSEVNTNSHGNDDVLIAANATSTINPTITDSSFTAARSDLLDLDVTGGAAATLTMNSASPDNSHFANSNPGVVSGGGGVVLSAGSPTSATSTLNYDIENATFEGALGNAVSIGGATGTNTVTGKFLDNTIGVAGLSDSGSKQGSDLSIGGVEHGTLTTAIEGNKLYQYNDDGVELSTADEAGSSPFLTLNATVENNLIAQPDATNALNGLDVEAGTGSPASETKVCLNASGNTLTGSGVSANGGFDANLSVNSNDTIQLQGYKGMQDNAGEIESFLKGANTLSTVGAFSNSGTVEAASSNCPTP